MVTGQETFLAGFLPMSDQPTDAAQPALTSIDPPRDAPKVTEATAALAALADAVSGGESAEKGFPLASVALRPPTVEDAKAAETPTTRDAAAPTPTLEAAMLKVAAASEKAASSAPVAPSKPTGIKAARTPAEAPRRYPLRAAGVALAIGLGVAGGAFALSRSADDGAEVALRQWTETTQASLRQREEDAARLSGEVRALKGAVDGLKAGLDRSKADGARSVQLSERLDRTDRTTGEIAAKLAKLSEQLEKAERADKDGSAKAAAQQDARAAQLGERLERLERQVQAAAATVAAIPAAPKPAPAAEPATTASIAPKVDAKADGRADGKVDPKATPVDGFVVRDVYNGMALIEGRNNRLYEVRPGANVPGLGRIEAIERQGRSWAVLTAKGVLPIERW
jgi:hypothetical protein